MIEGDPSPAAVEGKATAHEASYGSPTRRPQKSPTEKVLVKRAPTEKDTTSEAPAKENAPKEKPVIEGAPKKNGPPWAQSSEEQDDILPVQQKEMALRRGRSSMTLAQKLAP